MPTPYFFFRPILAADRSWSALDWCSGSPLATESTDFVRCFKESAAVPLANMLPLVMPVSPSWLEQDNFVGAFDPRQTVFILPTESLDNASTLAQCKRLHSDGYHLGLRLDSADLVRRVPLAGFEYLQFEAAFARQDLSARDLIYAGEAGFRSIATSVGSHEMFGWLSDKGFDWYDSHFLTARDPLSGKEPDLTRLKLLKLLNLVKHDGDTREIEGIFREEPKLAYNLLRLVNSVAVGARTKISNFSQAIAILGRRQLQRWLQLLIYANNLADGDKPNPLMQLAASRGRQIELLCEAIEPKPASPDMSDDAFMTGLFSLLEVLINLPMDEILRELPLQTEVMEALSHHPSQNSILGQLLTAVIASESGEFNVAEGIFSNLNISPASHAKAQVSAFYWASRINIDSDN